MKYGLLLIILFFTGPLLAAPPSFEIKPFEAVYEANKLGMTFAQMKLQLRQSPAGYLFESHSETMGIVSLFVQDSVMERSIWEWQDQAVKPQRYWYEQHGRKSRNVEVKFDWSHGRVNSEMDGNSNTYPLLPNAFDRLSYQVAVMQSLSAGKTDFSYHLLERKGFKNYRFQVLGTETLRTVLGQLETVKIDSHQEVRKNNRTTIFWCAKALNYLPVKILYIEKDGTEFYLYIKSLSGPLQAGIKSGGG